MTELSEDPSPDPCFLSVPALASAYRTGSLDPAAVAALHLQLIEKLEPSLSAFQLVDADGAMQAAEQSQTRWRSGTARGSLDGVPLTVKDNVDVAGLPTRHGSLTTDPVPAAADAPVVARLREAGAVILGKTTLPEFGWKGITDSPLRGAATRNPWDLSRSSGGSTGGGAAALAAGIGAAAQGGDGGGSIRIPASFCGVFGIKPSFGRVPHHPQSGLFATVISGGPLARSVEDAAVLLAVMARPDDRDRYALPPPADGWLAGLAPRLSGLRLGYAPMLGGAEPDAEVRGCVGSAIERLREAGARIEELGPLIEPLEPQFLPFWIAGMANRLRGIPRARWDELDPGYRTLAEQGLAVGAEAILRAEAARNALDLRFAELHRRCDLLLTPTTPHPAPPADTVYHSQGYDRWRDAVCYTLPFNLTGQPAASLPCGLTASGLPVGLQVIGPQHADRLVLEASLGIERVLGRAGRAGPAALANQG